MSLNERLYKQQLSLKITPGDAPFDLIGTESRFGPEDWAWQFLRLNDDYQKAYRTAQEQQQHAAGNETRQPERIVLRHACRNILADEDNCRNRFGLSTWLDPQQTRLPELERGESWFSPLSPIEITSTQAPIVPPQLAALWPHHTAHFETAFYVATNGVFGRAEKHNVENVFGERLRYQRPHLFFLVDSSVPPAGQLLEIENFVRYVRERMKGAVCTAPAPFRQRKTQATVEVLNEKLAGAFLRQVAPPLARGDRACDPAALWSVVKLDFRVALKENIAIIRDRLTKRHKELVANGVAAKPLWDRLRHKLSAPRKTGDIALTDGHGLKAYAVIAELRQIAGRDLTPTEIERVITERSCLANSGQPDKLPKLLDEWFANRVDRIKGYIDYARDFVAGDYRWLIYTQQPNASK